MSVQDFGQALDTSHPEHKEYLLRDLNIVNTFFRKKGVRTGEAQGLLESIVAGGSLAAFSALFGDGERDGDYVPVEVPGADMAEGVNMSDISAVVDVGV